MSITVHAPMHTWVRVHRATVVIVVLSVALAVTVALLIARLTADARPAAAAPVVATHLDPVDGGCLLARPGQPC